MWFLFLWLFVTKAYITLPSSFTVTVLNNTNIVALEEWMNDSYENSQEKEFMNDQNEK
jgi:hypothetical protein